MVDPYSFETYAGRKGETFRIVLDDRSVDTTLTSAREHPTAAGFSLVFVARGEILPQQIYTFAHHELGSLDIFVVPIARDAEGVSYEAVFTSAPVVSPPPSPPDAG